LKRLTLAVLVFVLLPASSGCFRSRVARAGLILTNGILYTAAGPEKPASAIAVRQGRILAVGDAAAVLRHRGPDTMVVDLKGATVIPGLIDAQVSLLGVGETLLNESTGGAFYLDLAETESEEDAVQRVRARARGLPPGEWILGKDWNQDRWVEKSLPDKRLLSDIVQNNPVFLLRSDGHTAWVNKRALDLAGISSRTPDPPGGRIVRVSRGGEPTGILMDRAWEGVLHHIPALAPEDRTRAVVLALQRFAALGHTMVVSVGTTARLGLPDLLSAGDGEAEPFRTLAEAGKLPIRVSLMIPGPSEAAEALLRRGPEAGLGDGHLDIRAIILCADGELGSRGAALLRPYDDDPASSGVERLTADEIATWASRGLRRGVQIAIQATGDAAVHAAAEGFAKALAVLPGADVRFRVGPLVLFDTADLRTLARFKVIGRVQPQALNPIPPAPLEEVRVGAGRAGRVHAYGTLLEAGLHLAGSSEASGRLQHPLLGFYTAVTRRTRDGQPAGGWHPEQRLGRPEALRLFTLGAAYAVSREREAGSLEPGKWADFTVLSQDILVVPEEEILKTEILATYVSGREVYRKEPPAAPEASPEPEAAPASER
jgi:hypothetical protein